VTAANENHPLAEPYPFIIRYGTPLERERWLYAGYPTPLCYRMFIC